MGLRGPPKKPTALKVVQGTASTKANSKHPQPKSAGVSCPNWIGIHGKQLWSSVYPQLKQLGLIKKLDREALAIACHAFHEYRIATAAFDPTEDTTDMRRIGQNANEAFHRWERMMKQFGMTPASREGLSAPAPPDEAAEFCP